MRRATVEGRTKESYTHWDHLDSVVSRSCWNHPRGYEGLTGDSLGPFCSSEALTCGMKSLYKKGDPVEIIYSLESNVFWGPGLIVTQMNLTSRVSASPGKYFEFIP